MFVGLCFCICDYFFPMMSVFHLPPAIPDAVESGEIGKHGYDRHRNIHSDVAANDARKQCAERKDNHPLGARDYARLAL